MGHICETLSGSKAAPRPRVNPTMTVPRRRRNNPPPCPSSAQAPREKQRKVVQNSPPGFQPQQKAGLSYAAVTQGYKPQNRPQVRQECVRYPPPVGFAVSQVAPPANRNYFPQQYQYPVDYVAHQQLPVNGYFQQGVPQFCQMPVMGYGEGYAAHGVPNQFVPVEQQYNLSPNLAPIHKIPPPPGFESHAIAMGQPLMPATGQPFVAAPGQPLVAANGLPLFSQFDAGFGANPSFVNCSFNQHIALDGPIYPPIPMQPFPLYIPSEKMRRRPKAISIIDPSTGADKLNEIYGPRYGQKMETEEEKKCASPKKEIEGMTTD